MTNIGDAPLSIVLRNCCAKSYLAGCFLAYGSCNSPNHKNYHLEISLNDLDYANFIVKLIEGDNDGLVSVESAKWGESFTLLTGRTNRGVSHYDEIDFRRAPLSGKKSGDGITDICDVYQSIVSGLAERGF